MNISDIVKLGWQLMIAGAGLIFAVFSLPYSKAYLFVGLLTFLYGVFAHLVDKIYWALCDEAGKDSKKMLGHILFIHLLIMMVWVYLVLRLLCFLA